MTHPLRPSTIECPDWAPDPADTRARRCAHYAGPSGRCNLERDGVPVRLMCTEWLKLKGHLSLTAASRAPSEDVHDESLPPGHCRRDHGANGACGGTNELCTCECPTCAPPDMRSAHPTPGDEFLTSTPVALPSLPPPPVLSLLAPPPPKDAPAPRPPPEDPSAPLRLVPAPPKPRKAADIAREALALGLGRSTTVTIAEPPPFEAAKAIDPADIAALEAAHPEVTLYSEELGGSVTLVVAPTGKDRTEITFRNAATLRMLVDSFPGSRVLSISMKK